jgi:hypothetical protein
MLYSEFKTFLATFLWRDGDIVLLAAMDSLIRMAEAGLQRDLKVQDATGTVSLVFVDSVTPIALPLDYRTPDVLLGPGGDYTYVTPGQFWGLTAAGGASGAPAEVGTFSIIGRDLYVSAFPAVQAPADLRLVYYRMIPSYQATDASWVADLHLDLLTYATLMHAGRFVRDDDRVPGWTEAYGAALASAIAEDVPNRYAKGAPLRIRYGGRHG